MSSTEGYSKLFDSKNDFADTMNQEQKKFFAVKPLYVLSSLQMIFGAFLLFAQVYVNNNCYTCSSNSGIWFGCVFAIIGLLCALTTKFKTDSLLVISSFLCVIDCGVSIASCAVMAIMALVGFGYNPDGISHDYFEISGKVYGCMAIVAGLNLIIAIVTSAFFCRAGCSCCQPQSPTLIYLPQTNEASNASTTVRVEFPSTMP